MNRTCYSLFAAFVTMIALPLVSTFAADKPATPVHDETRECRRVIAEAADHALVGSDSLLNLVAKSDRDRIEKNLTKADRNSFKKSGDNLQAMWKKKFGEDFNAEHHVDDLGGLKPVITGKGSEQTAVIQLPNEPGEKAYEMHLMRERNGYWRINLPDTVDGKTFFKNLMSSVDKVANDWNKIPDDQAQAYQRVVTELLHEMAFPSNAKS